MEPSIKYKQQAVWRKLQDMALFVGTLSATMGTFFHLNYHVIMFQKQKFDYYHLKISANSTILITQKIILEAIPTIFGCMHHLASNVSFVQSIPDLIYPLPLQESRAIIQTKYPQTVIPKPVQLVLIHSIRTLLQASMTEIRI